MYFCAIIIEPMGFDLKEVFTAGMILFAVIDIIGNIPLVISLRKKVGHIQSEKASIVSGIIMIAFLFVGEESPRGSICQCSQRGAGLQRFAGGELDGAFSGA